MNHPPRPIRACRHLRARQPAAASSNGRSCCSTGRNSSTRIGSTSRVELTDSMVERGFGDHIALIGNGRRRTYKELADWSNRLAHALVENYGVKPGHRVLIRSGNNPALVAAWLAATQGGRGRGQHHADAARRRTRQDRRQGRDHARAHRQPHRRRVGGLRQGQQVPQAGRLLRRHLQPRRRARPHRARQAGAVRGGADRPRRRGAARLHVRHHRRTEGDRCTSTATC